MASQDSKICAELVDLCCRLSKSVIRAKVDRGESGAARLVDERTGLVEAAHDVAPATHHDFELFKLAPCVRASEDDHACAMVADRSDFPGVLLDVAVSGDHQPLPAGGLGKSLDVQGAGLDRAWRPLLPEDDAA